MSSMKMINMIAFLLIIIGGINWGLIGLLDFNLVAVVFGAVPMLVKVIYIAVGVAAIYGISFMKNMMK